MVKDESKIWEKLFGKKVCSEKLNIEGYSKPMLFDIYNGYAVCENYKGHRFDMTFPQMKAVRDSDEIADAIIDYIKDITERGEITVLHTLIAFNTLYEDGVEIEPK